MSFTPPSPDCPLCPRLQAFREENRRQFPEYFNAPVPSFGPLEAKLLIVGLAPGLKGANQTGRPFTGDYAGFILYGSLLTHGFAKGDYLASLPDSVKGRSEEGENGTWNAMPKGQGAFDVVGCRITNAVRCVPPENKPEPSEIKTCNSFLKNEIAAMKQLKVIVSLGLVSHNAVLKALGHKPTAGKFGHAAVHRLVIPSAAEGSSQKHGKDPSATLRSAQDDKITLIDSYHCSRYNINTKRLSQSMFDEVIGQAKALCAG